MWRSLFGVALLVSGPSLASGPDFYIVTSDCKALLAGHGQQAVKVGDKPDIPSFACNREGKEIVCTASYSSDPTKTYPPETFQVYIDSSPLLYFISEKRFFNINTQSHAASHSELMSDLMWLAQKVCTATYATANEIELMNMKKK